MKYKDYSADIAYSEEDRCLVGHIAGITDIVGFHADTVAELQVYSSESLQVVILNVMKKVKYERALIGKRMPEINNRFIRSTWRYCWNN